MNLVIFLLLILEGFLMLAIMLVGMISIYFIFNSKFLLNAPPVPTKGKIKSAMINDVAKLLSKRKNQTVMDLGSGWGSLLIPLAKQFPQHKFIGFEYGYIPYLVSKFRAKNIHNLIFYRQDFFHADISKTNVIFLFLLPHIMPKIAKKCQKETPKGTLIFSNRFAIPHTSPYKKISLGSKYDTYYVYKM